MSESNKIATGGTSAAISGVGRSTDSLDAERHNSKAIQAMMERYDVDEESATDMWNRFIDTVVKLREKASAVGKA